MSELLAVPGKEYPQFMAGLSFMNALPPDEVVTALEARVFSLELRLVQWRGLERASADAGLPRLFRLEGEYEQRVMEAELDFVRGVMADIADGSLDGLALWHTFFTDDDSISRLVLQLGQGKATTREVPPAEDR